MSATATATARTTRAQIAEFLAERRLALVGVSRHSRDFSQVLLREFVTRGYDVVPVNPGVSEIAGQPCFARVQEVDPPVRAVLVLTPPAVTEHIVRDCAAAGVRHVWLHRGGGVGAVSPQAVAFCRERGISVIAGECPLMFLPHTQFVHRVHGFFKKLFRSYPQ